MNQRIVKIMDLILEKSSYYKMSVIQELLHFCRSYLIKQTLEILISSTYDANYFEFYFSYNMIFFELKFP